MCVLPIKVPILKKYGNLFNEPCITIISYLVSHEEIVSAVTHIESFFQEGKYPIASIHISPSHVVLKSKRKELYHTKSDRKYVIL